MDAMEQKIVSLIDQEREKIIAIGRNLWACPELGYKERKTSAAFLAHMNALGVQTEDGLAITGAKGYLKGKGHPGKTIALLGEMDALPISDSPHANPQTKAAHCCGHNAQMAGMMGAAFALCDPDVKAAMEGNVVFFAVPAEEFVEIEFKNDLVNAGKIGYGGGKCELIRIGAFDDIDVAVAHHIMPGIELAVSNHKSNGFVNKMVRYQGVSSHAAEAPELGVDALAAANLAAVALSFQRESFRDRDTVRIHGFISRGGEAMSVIADTTTMEYSVRANNIPALLDAGRKFDRSIRAAAIATGCAAKIITLPGYLPVLPLAGTQVMAEALADGAGSYTVSATDPGCIMGASTDCGDVSQLLPLLMFNTGGYDHVLHDKNMHPINEDLAYVVTAKVFALTAYKLLKNGGAYADALTESYRQALTKDDYIRYMTARNSVEEIPLCPEQIEDAR